LRLFFLAAAAEVKIFKKMFILAFEGKQCGFPKLHLFWIFAYYAQYTFASSYTQQKKH